MPQPRTPHPAALQPSIQLIKQVLTDALCLLLPIQCAICAVPDTRLCRPCEVQLEAVGDSPESFERPVNLDFPVYAAASYEGITRTALLSFKENSAPHLKRVLGALLARAIDEALRIHSGMTLHCVPVPSATEAVAKRGYRHVELLLAAQHPRPEIYRWLVARRERADQVGLTSVQRRQNARNSFRVTARVGSRVSVREQNDSRPLAGKHVLLVDDIVTTGASLTAAANALEDAGARVVAAVAVAHTPRIFA